jgi:hypothetical protein
MADEHLHDEALSDALDGTTPSEVASHLASCPACRARLDAMTAAARAVGQPPPPPSDAQRATAVARALATPIPLPRRRPVVAPWMAAAALIAVLLGIGGVVLAGRDDATDRQTTAAGQSNDKAVGEAGGASGLSAAVIDGGDLGDQRDPVALNTALQDRLSGAATDTAARTFAGESAPEAPAAAASAPACVAEAQTAGSGRVGLLVLTAQLRWQGEPAVVLVFAAPDQSQLSRRAFVMARRDCRLLVVQSF